MENLKHLLITVTPILTTLFFVGYQKHWGVDGCHGQKKTDPQPVLTHNPYSYVIRFRMLSGRCVAVIPKMVVVLFVVSYVVLGHSLASIWYYRLYLITHL